MITSDDRFNSAIAAFDAYHRKDPHTAREGSQELPAELLYAQRLTQRLGRYAPDASEALRLAARCQHIGRWEIARTAYPADRKGYLKWRSEERLHHARIAESLLSACGYDGATIEEVKALVLKKNLGTNPSAQVLEDVVCLVFIEFYLDDFASRHDDGKVVEILRKTFKKMSDRGRREARAVPLSEKIRPLVAQAEVPV